MDQHVETAFKPIVRTASGGRRIRDLKGALERLRHGFEGPQHHLVELFYLDIQEGGAD